MTPADRLRPDNRELFERVSARLNVRIPAAIPFEAICAEFDVTEDELVRFVLAYREPRKAKYQSPRFAALAPPLHGTNTKWAEPSDAQRFAAWRRAQQGAAQRIAELGIEPTK
jgi:hypothetical protein